MYQIIPRSTHCLLHTGLLKSVRPKLNYIYPVWKMNDGTCVTYTSVGHLDIIYGFYYYILRTYLFFYSIIKTHFFSK